MLSFRRLPAIVSRDLNVDEFATVVADFVPTLNDRSCTAVSVDGNDVGERNADLPVIPASTQKIVVAATALDVLGDDFRFTTEVVTAEAPVDGVVEGDLVLVGGGDPLLSSDWYPTSNLERRPVFNATSLDSLADSVQAAGVTAVEGSVLGDGSRYDDEFFAPGWGNGVAGLEAGPYDALMANDARVSGRIGARTIPTAPRHASSLGCSATAASSSPVRAPPAGGEAAAPRPDRRPSTRRRSPTSSRRCSPTATTTPPNSS